jgi:DNA-directed RNA polymerase specialized sigma24 family protein
MGVVGESRRGGGDPRADVVADLLPTVERAVRLIAGAGSPHAEDAVQEALIAIDRDLRQMRDPAAARAWAHRVATRCALRIARRERRRALIGLTAPAPALAVDGIDPSLGAIIEAFGRLPPRMRAVAVLRLHVGLSEQETADAVGCAPGTVKSQLFEARKRLAAELSDEERPR